MLQAKEKTALAKQAAYDPIWNAIQTATKNRGDDSGVMFPKDLASKIDAWQKEVAPVVKDKTDITDAENKAQ